MNGFKGSGKDTVGNYLIEEYGFEKLSFAAKLKDSSAALFNVDPKIWEEWKNDPNARIALFKTLDEYDIYPDKNELLIDISVREFLQRYGTEAHRNIFGQDFWVDHALKGVDPNKNYVFTDARFENELSKIKSLNGYNAQITRAELISDDKHVSEVPPPMHLIDYHISNNYGFNELWDEVDQFVEFLKIESYAS